MNTGEHFSSVMYKRRWLPAYSLLTLLYCSLGIWFFVHFASLVSLILGLVLGEVVTSDGDGSKSSSSLSMEVIGELLGLSLATVGRLIALLNASRLALKPDLFFTQPRFALAAPFACTSLLALALGIMQQDALVQLAIISPEALYAGLLVLGEGAEWIEWLLIPFEVTNQSGSARGTIQVISASEGTVNIAAQNHNSPETSVQVDSTSQSLFHSIKEHMNKRFFPTKRTSDNNSNSTASAILPDTSTSNLLLHQQDGAREQANMIGGAENLVREASAQV